MLGSGSRNQNNDDWYFLEILLTKITWHIHTTPI